MYSYIGITWDPIDNNWTIQKINKLLLLKFLMNDIQSIIFIE